MSSAEGVGSQQIDIIHNNYT